MTLTLTPASEAEAAAMVIEARAMRRPMRLQGGGTRAGLGRPVEADTVLSSSRLSGITLHEPAELVIGAWAGTPVSALEAALAAHGQMLPVEPIDHRGLYGTAGEPTLGGLVATNASGPRRVQAGAMRDHLIGVRLVNGRGEMVKSGGRVMKNVTGLDLVKLECGAHGTLGFLTELTFKVLPRPEIAGTLVWSGLDDARAVALLTQAIGSPFEISGAAHVPAAPGRSTATTLLRLEGFEASIESRVPRVAALLADFGAADRLGGAAADALWADIRDGRSLAGDPACAIWRVSVPPTRGPEVVAHARTVILDHFYDWAGGLIWIAAAPDDDAGAAVIRTALAPYGGHATLVRAPDPLRRALDVFEPLAPAVRSITAGIKASFDPDGLFNPGRMYEGI